MQDKLAKLIKIVYKKWKIDQAPSQEPHPDEDTLVCFLEDRLSVEERERIKDHLIACDGCIEVVSAQLKLKAGETKEMPQGMLEWARNLTIAQDQVPVFEVYLKIKEKLLEVLSTTGDVLVGQELVPASILRSRKIKDFKDEINILKDFKDIRVEAKIENKQGQAFSLMVVVKEKVTQRILKDLRVTLIKDDLELESYLTTSGKVTFGHVLLGKYTIEIATVKNKIATILLDIKV